VKGRLLGLIACMVLSGVSQVGATVYDLVGTSGISVSGTITTDGDTGVLTASDITDWHINQTFDTVHFQSFIDPANSIVTLTGTALTATPTQLLFDFGDTASSKLDFSSNNFFGGSGGLSLQLCDAVTACIDQNLASSFSEIAVVVIAPGCCSTSDGVSESGVTEIAAAAAAAVPEPSAWAMMLLGFAGAGFVCYRRAKSGRATLAA
jgi:PEP-CTERM motif